MNYHFLLMPTCHHCQSSFEISKQDKEFYQKISPQFPKGGSTNSSQNNQSSESKAKQTFPIPNPKLCPKCRAQRKMAWRNDRNLYHRKCDFTGKDLISRFRPDSPNPVVDKELWWSDQWDFSKYAKEFDFDSGKTFFQQFSELVRETPMAHTIVGTNHNSLYTNYTHQNKNCYLCFAGNFLEDSLYCYNSENSRDCCDCYFVADCELCYECSHCSDCYNLKFSLNCSNCSDSAFLEDCRNCKDCFFCWNLENAQYCFLNKQYSKEEYQEIIAKYPLTNQEKLKEFIAFWERERPKYYKAQDHNISAENCSGQYIINSKNCHNCYIMNKNCEDCRYIINGFPGLIDAHDCCYSGEDSELLYECIASGANCYNLLFCHVGCINSSNLFYCNEVFGCKNCFGCSAIRNAEYHIFNKPYSKEEYFELVPQIIQKMIADGEWGEFFPMQSSVFCYNETLAQEYFPLTEESAKEKGLKWLPKDKTEYSKKTSSESILVCEKSGKNYKLSKQELQFYKKIGVAMPNLCFEERHKRRISLVKIPF